MDGGILELIMINSDKIKIMLTHEDMTKYNINMLSQTHTGNAIKEAFFEVLSDIKSRTGFDTLSKKNILQVYPSRDGGCEVYITKTVRDLRQRDNSGESDNSSKTELSVKIKHLYQHSVFSFEKAEDLIDGCRLLAGNGYNKKSHLYIYRDLYYLVLEIELKSPHRSDELTFLSEFGKRYDSKLGEAFLKEHGNLVINENAVKLLAYK